MIPDTEILAAIHEHRMPIERKRLAGKLGIDDDAELAGACSRLVRENMLSRHERPGPGKSIGFCYWLTTAGKRALKPADEPIATHTKEPAMSRIDESNARRARIIAIVTAHPGILANSIAEKAGLDKQLVHRDLFAMVAADQIHRASESRPFGYAAGPGGPVKPSTKSKDERAARKKKVRSIAPAKSRRGRSPKNDALIAPKPQAVASPASANGFRVALTSDNTLIMQRRNLQQEVELQPNEIVVLTAFLRRLDQATPLTP